MLLLLFCILRVAVTFSSWFSASVFIALYGFAFCISSDIVVDQNQALRFALDIARGMDFLHSLEPMIPRMKLNSKHVMVNINT